MRDAPSSLRDLMPRLCPAAPRVPSVLARDPRDVVREPDGREFVYRLITILRSDLGLIGLAEFLPLPLLALPAGALADRFSRRLIFAVSVLLELLVAALLLAVTAAGVHALWPYLALALLTGVSGAIGSPASRAMPPTLVPTEYVSRAMALQSMASQMAVVTAVGGSPSSRQSYAVAVVMFGGASLRPLIE